MIKSECEKFASREALEMEGFEGFESIGQLLNDCYSPLNMEMRGSPKIPTERGVYMVLHPREVRQEFVLAGKNGFPGGNPCASFEYLGKRWVEGTIITYIGQAGGGSSTVGLRERIRRYLKHGRMGNGGHRGGRLIWHVSNPSSLVLCWKVIAKDDPERVESRLLAEFEECYKTLPFGNINRGKTFADEVTR